MLGIVAVGIETKAMTEARLADELIFGYALDEINKPLMSIV